MAPPVDIYETQEGLTILADVPGVAHEALDVRVDKQVLTIRGQARHGVPGEAAYREYELVTFFRQFALSEHVDPSQITAALKNGMLTVHVPKAQAAPPRQIAVHAA
jgi:HSP20 family molecular chaperone IbpA